MKPGHSGAKISICDEEVKKSGRLRSGILEQAALCAKLHPVTPKVYDSGKAWLARREWYLMEKLDEPIILNPDNRAYLTEWAVASIHTMRSVLWLRVWSKKSQHKPLSASEWVEPLRLFLKNTQMPVYDRLIDDLFLAQDLHYSMIHGDPTLANVLFRKDGALVITDPIPPVGKIPAHYTVDLGKMLQSAIGWELHQFRWLYNRSRVTDAVLEGLSTLERAQAWFWCAVHCLRIIPYTTRPETKQWAEYHARAAIDNARSEQCSISSISMAR